MPTYEYECTVCGHTFEEFQAITDKPLAKCPKCGAPVRRLISGGAGLIFKGSGFYVTDYKRPHLPQKRENKGSQLKKPDDKPGTPAVPKEKKD